MGKKKEKDTDSKKTAEKNETPAKGGNLTEKAPKSNLPEFTRGTGKTNTQSEVPAGKKSTKVVAGGIVAVAIGALALVGLNMPGSSSSSNTEVQAPAAAVVTQQQPVSSAPAEAAAAAAMIPQPLAPQKTQLAEPTKPTHEVAKPSKESAKKSAKLAKEAKGKDSVKKAVVSNSKQKAVKTDKKAKKTLAAKSID